MVNRKSKLSVLKLLEEKKVLSVSDISKHLKMNKKEVDAAVFELESDEYVKLLNLLGGTSVAITIKGSNFLRKALA